VVVGEKVVVKEEGGGAQGGWEGCCRLEMREGEVEVEADVTEYKN
jgi:hypothetical protein